MERGGDGGEGDGEGEGEEGGGGREGGLSMGRWKRRPKEEAETALEEA
jgi:hypothetical protein